ncbi:hypothetical protein GGI26_005198 [Coemansia sp. RSA 1358]|nr:hypothetical protein EDC05_004805 [Coemansia umbellata]KAJ2620183.1 hypothetical protein GGI26_005198 [Coemansia sp. RSA 1358]
MHKRQMYGGVPGVEGMNERYSNPFAAFINQGLVPGQGFPQMGMSAYGYGLPGLGLSRFLNPDAVILEGAGKGEISDKDLDNLDNKVYGYDRFKADSNKGADREGDPAYPGCLPNEDCGQRDDCDDEEVDHRHHHHNYNRNEHYHNSGTSMYAHCSLATAAAIAAAIIFGV